MQIQINQLADMVRSLIQQLEYHEQVAHTQLRRELQEILECVPQESDTEE